MSDYKLRKLTNYPLKKLTITKVLNKAKLILGLRNIYYQASLNEVLKKIENLPYTDELRTDEATIKMYLDNNAEYLYSRVPADWGGCTPPWDKQEYIDAENWMKTLPEED